ncbi:Rieske (2Fe-2S) protein [Paralimibaculum aggregatum]|uniref:Rieske (2Fe-2S) protein n=1 Tax=Paralimibaculum aggregatum TaxID=3036245 RepID=A0ABQ6LP86_9RHOB|nr:Rieske (2Fe-2S) protein [Limibaculum sp. NKW23]GMG84822.1 Rieske (2Fe-2S) protein [Limibaculum sp. NKW23]
MSKHVVGRASEIPPNARKLVSVKGRPIVIFNLDGEWFALLNRCPHQGGDLCKGRQVGLIESEVPGEYRYSREGEFIRCPWHGWEFDIRTGKSKCRPADIKVRRYDVERAAPGEVPEELQVEKFDVSVEDDYLIVEV